MPHYFTEVRQISDEAHGALTASFSCGDISHGEHWAAVCLDTEVIEEIRLNMAITVINQRSKSVNHPESTITTLGDRVLTLHTGSLTMNPL